MQLTKEVLLSTVTADTACKETWANSAPIQQVWLYLNSSRALCGSASHGQGYCARTCRGKHESFMSQDRDKGTVFHQNGSTFWKAWHTCYQFIHLDKTPEGILDINIRVWVFSFGGNYHIFWRAHALWFFPQSWKISYIVWSRQGKAWTLSTSRLTFFPTEMKERTRKLLFCNHTRWRRKLPWFPTFFIATLALPVLLVQRKDSLYHCKTDCRLVSSEQDTVLWS